MKILLLTNDIKWKSLPKRVADLELSFRKKLKFKHDTVSIKVKPIKAKVKISSWNGHVDEVWFRNKYILPNKDKYDAIGMVIAKKDWKGRSNLGGFYIVNSDTTHSFYIICGERTKAKGGYEFEEYLEHELLGHGLNKELGFIGVNDTGKFLEGQDNTHYFFYHSTKKEYYKYIEKEYNKIVDKMESKLQIIKDKIQQLNQKKVKKEVVKGVQPLIERQSQRLIDCCFIAFGYNLRVTSFYRSFEEQNALYEQGRSVVGQIVTNAKGGQSLHNYGVAFDIVDRNLGYNIDWEKVSGMWSLITDYKGEWGGNWTNIGFVDAPHFQNTLGHSLKDFQQGKVDYKKFK